MNRSRFSFRLFSVLATACALPLSGRADTPDPYSGSNWALLDTKSVLAAAADIDTARFPDSDSVTVDEKDMRVVHEDGTAECQDESFQKILTERGRRDNTTLTREYMLPYMTLAVPRLEIIKPDGRVVTVDVAANAKESIDASMMQENIYDPNEKIYRINIPGLEIGDIVHSVVRLRYVRPFIPGEYAEYQLFEDEGYIRHTSFEVRLPADKPLRQIELRHEVPGTVVATTSTSGGERVYHWDVNAVPRYFPEPGMPPPDEVVQRLSISTSPDWSLVSKWYWDLSKPHLDAITPEMTKKVADLTAGAATDRDKIKAIFYYVSKDIRYMGLTFEKDRPGFEPHDACVTFEKKYGVCRDKAALLVSLLRAAGENAYPVLVSVGLKQDPTVPNPFFNHAIVGVELEKGRCLLMDPTAENTTELLPAYDDDQSYLVCRPEGDILRLSPVDPAEKNMMEISTTGTLSPQGTLSAHSELTFNGANDEIYRQALAQMRPDDRRRFFEYYLKRAVPGAVLKGLALTPSNLLDPSQVLRARLDFTVPNAAVFGGGKAVVDMPWLSRQIGIMNFVLRNAGLEKRRFPLKTELTCGLREDISLNLANDFTGAISMPTCAPQDNDCLSYRRSYGFKDGILTCSGEAALKTVEFTPEQYLQLRDVLKDVEEDSRKAPLLSASEEASAASVAVDPGAAPPAESGVDVLEDRMEARILDAHDATYHTHTVRKILTYEGKKSESEFKIAYNPATEDARMIKAVVTSKDGVRQEISPQEITVMDADWNASAKRYTGGKVLVASLPGVEIGSTIELEYEVAEHGKPYVARTVSLQLQDETEKLERRVTAPAGLDVQVLDHGSLGDGAATRGSSQGDQVWSWQAANEKAIPRESNLPPNWYWKPEAVVFAGDFHAYLADLDKALLAHSAASAKAAEVARGLVQGAPSRLAALQAIRDYVVRSVRKAGPDFTELPLSELSDADTTLADGYGHGADRAILMHAMLAAAGFEPQFILDSGIPAVGPLSDIATRFPLPDTFDDLLVRVDLDGQSYYLNDTDQYARLGSTGHDGYLAIALSDRHYLTIKSGPGDETRTANHYHLAVTDNGSVRLDIKREYYGMAYDGQKKTFSEMPPEERRRYFQRAVSAVAQGARPIGDLKTDFSGYPGVEEFSVAIDRYAVVDGKYLYLDLPYSLRLFPTTTDWHTLPMLIHEAHLDTVQTDIDLPPGYTRVVIAPETRDLTAPSGAGEARFSTRASGKNWSVTASLDAEPAVVAPSDYEALLRLESTLENRSSRFLLLQNEAADPPPGS